MEKRIIPPNQSDKLELAWEIKEKIKRKESIFRQTEDFFKHVYLEFTVYSYLTHTDEELIGYAITNDNGYILFLAVNPDFQGENYGRRLIDWVAQEHKSISCHVRTTNTNAIGFYNYLGFQHLETVTDYYTDGGSAHYIRYTPNSSELGGDIPD